MDSSHSKDKVNITNCGLAGALHKASSYCLSARVFVVTSLDPHARLLQVAEGIDDNVEDLEDEIDDIGDEIEDMEDEIEDFGEGIEDMETGVQAVAAKMVGLQREVQTMRNTLESL